MRIPRSISIVARVGPRLGAVLGVGKPTMLSQCAPSPATVRAIEVAIWSSDSFAAAGVRSAQNEPARI